MAKQTGLLLLTTVPQAEQAQKIAQELVKNRLAACVNIIGPIASVYHWNDQIVNDSEYKLLIKTATHLKDQAVAFIQANHSYQVPEISALAIEYTNPDYADWLFQYLASP